MDDVDTAHADGRRGLGLVYGRAMDLEQVYVRPNYRQGANVTVQDNRQIAEALCAADSILSLLHYRHRNELGQQNRADVEAAVDKLSALRRWYEPELTPCRVLSSEGYDCDLYGSHEEHEHRMVSGSTMRWAAKVT